MARKSTHITVLQFDTRRISALRVLPAPRGVEVAGFYREQGAWNRDDGSLAEALKAFLDRHGLRKDRICTILPRHDITTRILRMPTHNEDELANMVLLSAEEFVPFSADELIIDQCLLERFPSGECQALAVLAHRDVVNAHIDLVRQAGVEPHRILLSSACMASAAIAAGASEMGCFALVNLASGGLEVVVLKNGQMAYSRGVGTVQDWTFAEKEEAPAAPEEKPLGIDLGGDPVSGGEAAEELVLEVRGSLATYRRESEDGLGAESIFLCSDHADLQSACAALQDRIGKPCSPAEFASKLVEKGLEHLGGAVPLALLGAALSAQDHAFVDINLLPESLVEKRQLEEVKRLALHGAVLAAMIVAALGGLYWQAVHQREVLIDELQGVVSEIGPSARGIASKQEQLQILRREVDRRGSVLELLAVLTEAAPPPIDEEHPRVNINRFSYDRRDGLDLWGRALTVDDVANFTRGIHVLAEGHLEALATAKRVYEKRVVERDEEVWNFQIEVSFPEEEDAESVL